MTAPEPLKLTLEEAMERLYDERAALLYPLAADCWEVVRIDRASPFAMTVQHVEKHPYRSWPEAVSEALGRPVVERRDDTAELVELLREARDFAITSIPRGAGAYGQDFADRIDAALARVKGGAK